MPVQKSMETYWMHHVYIFMCKWILMFPFANFFLKGVFCDIALELLFVYKDGVGIK